MKRAKLQAEATASEAVSQDRQEAGQPTEHQDDGGVQLPPDLPPAQPVAVVGRGSLVRGYILTLGVLGALVTGLAVYNLRGIVFSVFLAMFVAVGLDPLVRWLQRRGLTRGWATAAVIMLIVALMVGVLLIVIPLLVGQVQNLITGIPAEIVRLRDHGWFDEVNAASNGVLGNILTWISGEVTRPQFLATVGTGAVGLGFTIANAVGSGFFIAILSIYFVGTYDSTRNAAFGLISASRRENVADYTNRILENVGRYLSGMVLLALANATFSVVVLLIMGVPGAFVIGIVAFLVTLIPMIGTVLTTFAMSLLALVHSPTAGLVVFIAMLVYMQLEAYVFTPKVMSKAVKIPGSVVLISAVAGGTLFGLPGALVAIPISAGVILVLNEVVLPAKNRS